MSKYWNYQGLVSNFSVLYKLTLRNLIELSSNPFLNLNLDVPYSTLTVSFQTRNFFSHYFTTMSSFGGLGRVYIDRALVIIFF